MSKICHFLGPWYLLTEDCTRDVTGQMAKVTSNFVRWYVDKPERMWLCYYKDSTKTWDSKNRGFNDLLNRNSTNVMCTTSLDSVLLVPDNILIDYVPSEAGMLWSVFFEVTFNWGRFKLLSEWEEIRWATAPFNVSFILLPSILKRDTNGRIFCVNMQLLKKSGNGPIFPGLTTGQEIIPVGFHVYLEI